MKRISSSIAVMFAAICATIIELLRPLNESIQRYQQRSGLVLMAITQTERKGSGPNRFYTARHLDDAATPAALVLYPGFKPRHVIVENLTDRIRYEYFQDMAEGDYLKTVAAGTRTLETDDVLVVEDDEGARPSITLVAAAVLQNKQYQVIAVA